MEAVKSILFIVLSCVFVNTAVSQSMVEDNLIEQIIIESGNISFPEQLHKISIKQSPFGVYGYYHQALNGKPIFNTWIKVKKTDSKFGWVKENTVSIPLNKNNEAMVFPEQNHVLEMLRIMEVLVYEHSITIGFWYLNGSLIPVVKAEILDELGDHYQYIFESHEVISKQLKSRYLLSDTTRVTANGLVFNPDPLTSAKVIYGGDYIDNDDGNVPALNLQRVSVEFECYQINDTFFLQNEFVKIDEISSPKTGVTFSNDGNFSYTRDQFQFEDVNVFYHLTNTQFYLKSLGFNDLGSFQIRADAHALNGRDNSRVTTFGGIPKMEFGEGGVDDGEDADVIVHEYVHALIYDASPESNSGNDREAMDEGFGDYLASSYSRNISEFNWGNMFTWDGHNEYWGGRNIDNDKIYPDNLGNSIHLNGEIWAAALMDIWKEIGKETTDKITIGLFYEMYPNMLMPQAAERFLQLDSQYTGGTNSPQISKAFFARGLMDTVFTPPILPDTTLKITILGSEGYGYNPVVVNFSKEFSGKIELFDGVGRFIWGANLKGVTEVTVPYRNQKPFGIYHLRVTKGFERFNYPILKPY
jgi:hypothetical protein